MTEFWHVLILWKNRETQKELRDVGLSVNHFPGKWEAILAAGETSVVNQAAFPELQLNHSGNFTMLKTSIGALDFCEAYVQRRRALAKPLFERLPEPELE